MLGFTQLKTDGKTTTLRTFSVEDAMKWFKWEELGRHIDIVCDDKKWIDANDKDPFLYQFPKWIFGATFRKCGGERKMTKYNGIVVLEFNQLSSTKEAENIRKRVSYLRQTYMTFVGIDRHSVKVLVRYALPDGSLPNDTEQVRTFHAAAYRDAAESYRLHVKNQMELHQPSPDHAVWVSYDPDVYHNAEAEIVRMEQPTRKPGETPSYAETKQAEINPIERMLPGYDRVRLVRFLYERATDIVLDQLGESLTEDNMHRYVSVLSEVCFESGIPEEDAVKFCLYRSKLNAFEMMIRQIFKSTYKMSRNFGASPCLTDEMLLEVQLEDFVHRRLHVRRNVLKGVVEMCNLRLYGFDFKSIAPETLNGLVISARKEGIRLRDKDMRRYLESDRVPVYNPVEDYLMQLPAWDKRDRIRQMASCVKCSNPRWQDLFYVWFLAMVANWQQRDRNHGNCITPVLVGDQGTRKSTFCRNILPHELRDYYRDSVDFSKRADLDRALCQCLLINLDEFDSIPATRHALLKHILQKPEVKTRRPYSIAVEQMPRYASFIATSNSFQLLSDPTGSRRYLCVEVEDTINLPAINYSQLYAQAVEALERGERYWFTVEEEAYVTDSNQDFQQTVPVLELVKAYFNKPQDGEKGEWLTCTQMLERIRQRHNSGLKCTSSMIINLGRSLHNSEFDAKRTGRGGRMYHVAEINEQKDY